MALNRSRTEFPLYVLNRRKSETHRRQLPVTIVQVRSVCVRVCVRVPVCRGTEMCILQLVRTTDLPAVSSLTTMGLSAGSFSIRSLTSCIRHIHKHTIYDVYRDSGLRATLHYRYILLNTTQTH